MSKNDVVRFDSHLCNEVLFVSDCLFCRSRCMLVRSTSETKMSPMGEKSSFSLVDNVSESDTLRRRVHDRRQAKERNDFFFVVNLFHFKSFVFRCADKFSYR